MPRVQAQHVAVLRDRGMALLLVRSSSRSLSFPGPAVPYGSSGRYLIDAMMTVNMLVGVLATLRSSKDRCCVDRAEPAGHCRPLGRSHHRPVVIAGNARTADRDSTAHGASVATAWLQSIAEQGCAPTPRSVISNPRAMHCGHATRRPSMHKLTFGEHRQWQRSNTSSFSCWRTGHLTTCSPSLAFPAYRKRPHRSGLCPAHPIA